VYIIVLPRSFRWLCCDVFFFLSLLLSHLLKDRAGELVFEPIFSAKLPRIFFLPRFLCFPSSLSFESFTDAGLRY